MRPGLRRFYVVAALVLAVSGLVSLALLQPVVGTRTDLSIYNTNWDGASRLAGDLYASDALLPAFSVSVQGDETEVAHRSFASFELDPATTTLLILGPTKPPSDEEAARLARFVEDGGRLVVADDIGSGDAFLEAAGAETRFDGRALLDLAFAKDPHFVVTTAISAHPLTAGVDELVLDYATVLRPGPDATVLAETEGSAWLDTDLDEAKDPGEPAGPFPLIATEPVGQGTVAIVADPSLYINGMREVADDGALVQATVAWMTDDGRQVLIDEAHRDYPDPVRFLGVRLAALPPVLRHGLALAALGGFLTVALGSPERWLRAAWERARGPLERLFPPPEGTPQDPVEVVLDRHPEWGQSTLQDIVVAWEEANGG